MSKNLIPAQRRKRIQEYLGIYKFAHIADLTQLLDVSEATVRRDLERLENEGILERTHGGAMLSQRVQLEPEYLQRAQRHPKEKRLIGMAAALEIEDGDILFINSGTTTTQVIRHIPEQANITVVTNNLSAALEVGEAGFDLILLGGFFQPKSNSVAGRYALENLEKIYASKTIVGVDGISLKYGCTVPSSAEADLVRLMMERTRGPIIVVADSSKWGVVSNYQIATIDQIHKLITEDGLNEQAYDELADHSVEVLVASQILEKA
jgi:DeoR/GlpR family transcriptional regulator of sugar metabolism